jgi:IS5 family transposase
MPAELVAVDRLLDDPRLFEPFRAFFDPAFGRPSIPMETYLRLMFLKYRYRLGYETLCAERRGVRGALAGIIVDYEIQPGMPPDAPRLAPAIERAITATGVVPDAVTADRGYGQASVDLELTELGVDLVAILRKGKPGVTRQQVEAAPAFVEMIKWRTGAEGRISALKRQHGWGRARLRTLEGARTWCGWGVLSHNAIKIAALSN